MLADKLWGAVLDEVAAIVETGPLGETVGDVHDTLAVEHVASAEEFSMIIRDTGLRDCIPRLEVGLVLVVLKVNQAGEEQDHVSTLVHDGTVAVGAANLAGKLMLNRLGAGVVPLEIMVSVREVDVFLVEDGSPLERCS